MRRSAALACLLVLVLLAPSVALGAAPDAASASAPAVEVPAGVVSLAAPLVTDEPAALSGPSPLGAQAWDGAAGDVAAAASDVHAAASAEVTVTALRYDYSWSPYLVVDGLVRNNSATTASGRVAVLLGHFSATDELLGTSQVTASAYSVPPGGWSSFQVVTAEYPADSTSVRALDIAWESDPTVAPIDLQLIDESVVAGTDGGRTYTLTWRNNASTAVEAPVVGGAEYRADTSFVGSMHTYALDRILPGATWTCTVGAFNAFQTVSDTDWSCQALAFDATSLRVTEISGATRIETAIAASKAAYPDGAQGVVIATSTNWPDALSGSSFAALIKSPILLTEPGALNDVVRTEIERLGADTVFILGGERAVSSAVEKELASLVGASQVARIAGPGRYATSCMVANVMIETEMGVWGSHSEAVFLASGENYPDAVSASALGAGTRWPVVLVDPTNGLDPLAKATLKRAATAAAVMLGGTAAIPKVIHTQVSQVIGTVPMRLAGADRYATAVLAARFGVEQIHLSWDRVAIATGLNYPDALTGGVLQGRYNSVLLLTHPTSLPPSVGAVLSDNKASIYEVRYLGGPRAVSTGVRARVADVLR